MNKHLRFLFFFLLMAIPFLTFGAAAYFGLTNIDVYIIFGLFFLGLPFWFAIVLPIVLMLKLKSNMKILYLILIIAISITAWYLISSWTTNSYGLIIGNKVYIENGVPTALYYTSTLIDGSLIFLTIFFSSIFFIKLIEK